MRKCFIVLEHEAAAARVFVRHVLGEHVEFVLVRSVGGASEQDKRRAALERAMTRVFNQMNAFLCGEAGDDTDHGCTFGVIQFESLGERRDRRALTRRDRGRVVRQR